MLTIFKQCIQKSFKLFVIQIGSNWSNQTEILLTRLKSSSPGFFFLFIYINCNHFSFFSLKSFTYKDFPSYQSTPWVSQPSTMLVVMVTRMLCDFSSPTPQMPSSIWLITRKVKRRFTKQPLWSAGASATCLSPADPICWFKIMREKHQKYWHSMPMITSWQLILKVSGMKLKLIEAFVSILNGLLLLFYLYSLFLTTCRSRAVSLLNWAIVGSILGTPELLRAKKLSKSPAKHSWSLNKIAPSSDGEKYTKLIEISL